MAVQNQGDQFELYFKRADLDQDGRISGAEAVSFFQGSGLPKQVLAQVWMHADQNRTGFLNRQEFYNALKLVTVAQTKRELTPDIVKAAIYGPASSKIPAPQINLPPSPILTSTPMTASFAMPPTVPASPTMQMAAVAPTTSQNLGFRGQLPPNTIANQQYFPSQGTQMIRGPQVMPASPTVRPPKGNPPPVNLGLSANSGAPASAVLTPDFLGGKSSIASSGHSLLGPSAGISPSTSLPKTQDPLLASGMGAAKDTNPSSVSGNGYISNSVSGGDAFSSIHPLPHRDPSPTANSKIPAPHSSSPTPVSAADPSSSLQHTLDPLHGAFVKQPSSQSQHADTSSHIPVSSAIPPVASPGIASGAGNSIPGPEHTQPPWPKMTPQGVQKYTRVFVEMDTDRDGKITGEQARNLFLSWRLPREVLKQVWDLADQDSDSMLSLREFCIALYLMERYREARPLPASLPSNIMFDETLLRMTGPSNSLPGNEVWGATSGFGLMQGRAGAQQTAGLRPALHGPSPQADKNMQFNLQKSGTLVSDSFQSYQPSVGEQNFVQSNPPESRDGEKKVILDSKEKLEYYRTKMQELVLYKSRCDNQLNEIIERASADKREADLLGKKYEEKYKQAAEVASKLTIEEASFRECQERKIELSQAIINMEQGGSADGILQVRADRIQSDLEQLLKALSERCKKHGLEFKTMALIELPKGWLPGIPEGAAIWDEEWDKFEDEGLIFDVQIGRASSDPKSMLLQNEPFSLDGGFSPDSSSIADGKSEKHFNKIEHAIDSDSAYSPSEDDSGRSPTGSPPRRGGEQSPSQGFSDIFAKESEGDLEFHRFDDHRWGTFDSSYDAESVWRINPSHKESVHDQHGDKLFDSRTGTAPQDDGAYNRRSLFTFNDSVPGTPVSKSANSPRYSEAGDNYFDNYERFDSLSIQDSRLPSPRGAFTRFDSINSSSRGEAFARFDSVSSSKGEAFSRFDSISSSKGEGFGRFDSISSSKSINFDQSSRGFSFDDVDPFGSSGPFKVSAESQTLRKGDSEGWSSF